MPYDEIIPSLVTLVLFEISKTPLVAVNLRNINWQGLSKQDNHQFQL